MAKTKVTRNAVYKRAIFHTDQYNLQELFTLALNKRTKWGQRKQAMGGHNEEDRNFHVIAETKSEEKGMCFGTLLSFKPGMLPMTLVDDAEASTVTLEKFDLPEMADGKKRELIDAYLFFACIDNHLVLLQSHLRSDHLENYLQWFLHSAEVLAGDNTLKLIDSPTQKIRDMLAVKPVREIKISDELFSGPDRQHSPDVVRNVALGDASKFEKFLEFFGASDLWKLPIDNLGEDNLEFSLVVRYRNRTTEGGQQVLNAISEMCSNIDHSSVKIGLVGGGEIDGKEMRLNGPVRVTIYDGHPASVEVYEVLRLWLLEKIRVAEVPAIS